MNGKLWQIGVVLSLAPVVLIGVSGCSKDAPRSGKTGDQSTPVAEKKGQDHSGWWCDEHGVPEAECSMCSAKVAAERKKAGDWCEQHDRARSQCFICDASFKEKYAARYRAKYGKEPPAPTENEPPKNKDKK
jgi:hypothetical protein